MPPAKKRAAEKPPVPESPAQKGSPAIPLTAENHTLAHTDAVTVAIHAISGTAPPHFGVPDGAAPNESASHILDCLAAFAKNLREHIESDQRAIADDKRQVESDKRAIADEKRQHAMEDRELSDRAKRQEDRGRALAAAGGDVDLGTCRGACVASGRALGIDTPTPALVGRAMHTLGRCNETPPNMPLLKPVEVFQLIKDKLPAQIALELARELAKYGKPKPSKGIKTRKVDSTAHAATELKEHLDKRSQVLKLCHLADQKKRGKNQIDRFLIGMGVAIFKDWPAWGDKTGGGTILDKFERLPPAAP
jgi:hypothetical protein